MSGMINPSMSVHPATLVERFAIDLSDLQVYTEAASGSYLLTPVLAAVAGARKVYAQTRDSRFSQAVGVADATMKAAAEFGVADRIEILFERSHRCLRKCDIVTNSGFVRPIDVDLITSLKPTAVIPLMWETWEFRSADFDLNLCRSKEILVMGTNEHRPPCDMSGFIGYCALKLLFEIGFDGGKVLLLGNAPIPASPIVDLLRRIGIDVTWASTGHGSDLRYEELKDHFQKHGSRYDIMILAEHEKPILLLGADGLLDFEAINTVNPALRICVICGNIDVPGLQESGLHYLPRHVAPFGFISYQPYMLGPRPVLTLYAAGLKVGEAMARARLKGLPPREAAIEALAGSPAMDFEGELSWL